MCFFFFNDTATTEIYTLSLHDALPILKGELYFLDRESNNWLGIPTKDNPTSRSGCDITYVLNRNQVAMFGGDLAGSGFDDLWLFDIDSNSWTEVITDLKPPSRTVSRSEERRVGKECRSRWSPYH